MQRWPVRFAIPDAVQRTYDMTRRFIDLSITLCNDVITDPPFLKPEITYQNHMETAGELDMFFRGVTAEDTPDGAAFAASEWVRLTTHSGTHLDAPYHFHPTMDSKDGEPRRSLTIDEVPLEWCFQSGVKLDFRHFPDGYVVTARDVEEELARNCSVFPAICIPSSLVS